MDSKIITRVEEHKDYLVNEIGIPEYQILGVFAYGSMNYGTFVMGRSDIDTKAIYIPSYEELLWDKPIAKEYHLPNGEHCELKDIREMVKMWTKQNINFVEILFTPYCWINPLYERNWNWIKTDREYIARYNEEKTVLSITGQALNTLRQFKNSEEYSGKKLANCIRLVFFFTKWSAMTPYWYCVYLTGKELQLVMKVKYSTEPISPETIDEEYRDLLDPEYLVSFFEMIRSSSWDDAHDSTYNDLKIKVGQAIKDEPLYEKMWRIQNELSRAE